MKRTYRGIVPVPADVRTGSGGVDAVASAGAFAGVRTRTGQFLGLSPLPVGPRKHAQAIRKDMPAQSTVDSTTRAKSCTHACGGRAYCNTRHDRDHGAEPHAPPRPFPQPVGRLTRNAVAHVPGNLSRTGRIGFIGFAPTLPTEGWCESSTHRMMGAGDGPRVRRTNGDVDHRTRPAWS